MSKTSTAKNYLEKIRNLGIIAHIDAGKTTLTERILFYTKRIHRMGEVHDGTATMDYLPEEQQRGITITSAVTSCKWRDKQINIIDTPGHVDFTIEVERSLRVLDGAIGVFCAVGGVEPQSETVWRQSERYRVPKLAFVNKMDRLGADFEAALDSMRHKLGVNPLVLQIPIGQGEDFAAVADVLTRQRLDFDPISQGSEFQSRSLSAEEEELVLKWRERLIELLSEEDDSLLERYLAGEDIPVAELRERIRKETLSLRCVPVFAGSALKNIGVQPVLDAICDYLPGPLEVPQAQGMDPVTREKVSFAPSPSEPLSALVYKVTMETGRKLVLMRLYSGRIESGETVYNVTQNKEERVSRLFFMHAGHKERLDEALAGQIVAAAGMKSTRTGDTLARRGRPILLEKISQYTPVISLALEPKSSSEEERLLDALDKMLQEDPTLFLERDPDTEQIILSGMGELHLEVALDRLRREYNVELRSGNPQVVYQETIAEPAEAGEVFHKELGEVMHHGEVRLMVEPISRDRKNDLVFEADTTVLPREWVAAIEQGIEDGLQSGVLKGYPVLGARVRILELRRQQDSSGVGFHLAAAGALKKALTQASPQLMEPIMFVEVFVPDDFVGDVVSLLGSKGAKIENMFDRGAQKVVQSFTPLRELFGFSTALRSATQGRGNFIMKFHRFDVLQ